MSLLSEEIEKITDAKHCKCGDVGFQVWPNVQTGEPEQEQCEFCYTENSYFKINEIINKVLDAAVEAGNQHIAYIRKHTSEESNVRLIGIDIIEDYQDAINKLRGGK